MSRAQTFKSSFRLILGLGILVGYNVLAGEFPPGGEEILVQEVDEDGDIIQYPARLNDRHWNHRYEIYREGLVEIIRLGQVTNALQIMNKPYVFSSNGKYARKAIPLYMLIDKTERPPRVKIIVRHLTGKDTGVEIMELNDLFPTPQGRELEKLPEFQELPTSMKVDLVFGSSPHGDAIEADLLLKSDSHFTDTIPMVRAHYRRAIAPGIKRYEHIEVPWRIFIERYTLVENGNNLVVEELDEMPGKTLFEATPTRLMIHVKPDHTSTIYVYGYVEEFGDRPWYFHPNNIKGMVVKKKGEWTRCSWQNFLD